MIKVEICIEADNALYLPGSVRAAYAGGATTIELCSAMACDGLSPSETRIASAKHAYPQQRGLMVMVRPRQGDFCYSATEIQTMRQQIDAAAKSGANGVVLGVLDKHRRIDEKSLALLLDTSRNLGLMLTFHRAIDATPTPLDTLHLLIDYGVDRVLTSGLPWGQAGGASEGIVNLCEYANVAQDKIELVIAGGVNAQNVTSILKELSASTANISVHAYSSVLDHEAVSLDQVAALCNAVARA